LFHTIKSYQQVYETLAKIS